jgi:plasmid stability protein
MPKDTQDRARSRRRSPPLYVRNFPPDLGRQLKAAAKAARRSVAAETIVRLQRSLVADEVTA